MARDQFNPLDGLSSQPLNYMHNWTSPTIIKRKSHHTCRHVLLPWSSCEKWLRAVSWSNGRLLSRLSAVYSGQAMNIHWQNGDSLKQRAAVQHIDSRQGENRKKASCSLYLNELPGWECKFRDQIMASKSCLEKHSPRGSQHHDERRCERHTCSEPSYRISMWNATDVQKTATVKLTRGMKLYI